MYNLLSNIVNQNNLFVNDILFEKLKENIKDCITRMFRTKNIFLDINNLDKLLYNGE